MIGASVMKELIIIGNKFSDKFEHYQLAKKIQF